MRIEDLDRARDQGSAHAQLEQLASLGIDWDGEVMWQTERIPVYEAHLVTLEERGLLYECFCSRKEILEAPTAPHHPPGAYPGTCRDLDADARDRARQAIAPRRPALRLRLPNDEREVGFVDRVRGHVTAFVDDFVVMRGDGAFAYNLVSVIDDGAQGVDQVVRGDDLLLSTPRQITVQRLLNIETPEYIHVPLVLGPEGKRLAKRDGAVTLPQLLTAGYSAEAVLSMLGASLGLNGPEEPVTVGQMCERFDPLALSREPWTWQPQSRAE